MTIKEKLEEYDLFDNSIIKHGSFENVRDYEIIGYLSGQAFDLEVRYIFKGCMEVDYKNIVQPHSFSMDDRLLEYKRQDEPNYPQAFIWNVGADVYPGWKLEENTTELNKLEDLYKIKFYKISFETNAYYLTLVFHDLEITQLKRFEKSAVEV